MIDLEYIFTQINLPSTNNGRIYQMKEWVTGETVTYTYDALNRLTQASSTGMTNVQNSSWGEVYQFDGFGNLTQKGSQSIGVLAASNRLTGPGISYDSNGNQTGMQMGTTNVTNSFDIDNRLLEVSGQGFRYGFGPDNRKMWTGNASNGNEDYVFWGPQGKPIGTYRAAWEWTASSGTLWFNAVVSTRRWMGSKEISATSVLIHDRLSSVVGVSAGGSVSRYRYLPYGEPNTAGGTPVGSHFATYDRTDAGMYYADQRYYRDGVGRFMTADPYAASAHLALSASWNRYSYVQADPVNHVDPMGLDVVDVEMIAGGGMTVCTRGPGESSIVTCVAVLVNNAPGMYTRQLVPNEVWEEIWEEGVAELARQWGECNKAAAADFERVAKGLSAPGSSDNLTGIGDDLIKDTNSVLVAAGLGATIIPMALIYLTNPGRTARMGSDGSA